jgi:hypothetical protein
MVDKLYFRSAISNAKIIGVCQTIDCITYGKSNFSIVCSPDFVFMLSRCDIERCIFQFDVPLKLREGVHELFIPQSIDGKLSKVTGKCKLNQQRLQVLRHFRFVGTYFYVYIENAEARFDKNSVFTMPEVPVCDRQSVYVQICVIFCDRNHRR